MFRFLAICLVSAVVAASNPQVKVLSTPFLWNGTESEPGEYPYLAHIEYSRPSGETTPGTGVLISDRYLLARASMLAFWGNITVTLGAFYATREEPEQQKFFVNADDFIYLEDYNIDTDIAIIPLPRPAQLTPRIQPIALPRLSDKGLIYAGWNAIFNGWSYAEDGNLRSSYLSVSIGSTDKCGKFDSDGILCVPQGFVSGVDPGAPLVIQGSEGPVLVGIFSYSTYVGKAVEIFIRTNEHLEFIANNTNVIIKP